LGEIEGSQDIQENHKILEKLEETWRFRRTYGKPGDL